jgi:hypothetical protein
MFKSYTYTWWQMGIFKVALLAIGVLIGSYWSEFWNGLSTLLAIVAVITSVYVMYVSLKQ